MRILINENQFKRIFLGPSNETKDNFLNENRIKKKVRSVLDGKVYEVFEDSENYYLACDRGKNQGNCFTSDRYIPYWWTLKNPFNDGYDYQYRVMNKMRRWIRRPIKDRSKGVDLMLGAEMKFGPKGYNVFIDDPNDLRNFGLPESQRKLVEKIRKYHKLQIQRERNVKTRQDEKFESWENKLALFETNNNTLKSLGWPTISTLSDIRDPFLKGKSTDIGFKMINYIGLQVLKDISYTASAFYPQGGDTQSRYVYSFTLGPNGSYAGNPVNKVFENFNIYNGKFANEVDTRGMLKNVENLNTKKYPWGSFFVFGNFIGSGSLSGLPITRSEFKEQFGTEFISNWIALIWGTTDPSKIKSLYRSASAINFGNRLNFPRGRNELQKWNKMYGHKAKERPGFWENFGDYIATWDEQDWIDAAAIILYLIPTPLTWGIATGLEITNIGISINKGEYGDAAIRAGFIVGGAILSKAFSTTYKVSSKSAQEASETLAKIKGLSGPEARKVLEKELKNVAPETRQFIDDLFTMNKGDMDKLVKEAEKNLEFMEKVEYNIKNRGMSENKAVRNAGVDTFGETTFEKYWKHVAPTTASEATIMSILYASMQTASYASFKKAMKERGIQEKNAVEFMNNLYESMNVTTTEEGEDIMLEMTNNLVKQEQNRFLDKLPIYDSFTENCIDKKNVPVAEFDIDPVNEKISNGGIDIKAGGPYDYKIFPDVDSIDSWGYVKGKNDKIWKRGSCETTKILLENYCKGNTKDIKTSAEGRTCFIMMGGDPDINAINAALYETVKGGTVTRKKIELKDSDLNKIMSVLDGYDF